MSYNISASQFHQKGTTIGNFYDRYTFRTNLDARPKTWLRTGVNINLSYDKKQRNSAWGNSEGASNYTNGGLSYVLNPLYPAYDEDGNMLEFFPFGAYSDQYKTKHVSDVTSRYGLNGNAYIEIEPIKNLRFVRVLVATSTSTATTTLLSRRTLRQPARVHVRNLLLTSIRTL